MIYKSYTLEENFESILKCKMFLFYGENQGLKKDFIEKIRLKFKDFEILYFFQDEILKDEIVLVNEIKNKSLFESKKIVIINHSNDKILDLLNELSSHVDEDKIFLFSDILEKKSKLRNLFEKSNIFGITACYSDNEITLRKIISKKLEGFQGLTGQVMSLIIHNTGLDRNKINNEIDKIKAYFKDSKIDVNKIDSLLNLRTNEDFNLLKDEVFKGNRDKTNRLLGDTIFETENNIYYLNSINQRINKLNEIENMKKKGANIEQAISNLKPPIFWKDKPVLIEQSHKWNKKKILTALKKSYTTELKIKSNSSIRKDLLIKNLLIDLCTEANSA